MALETEIKLSLPASAARRLPAHGLLADSKPLRQKLVNTYYDTPDRRLQRKRVAVRYQSEEHTSELQSDVCSSDW